MILHILGCHAATPRTISNPTAQVLEIRNKPLLIDCGEGTQVQLRKNKLKFSRIEHIFISHLHGDHFFGLPGLLTTFQLLGREKPLHIYGPKGIKKGITLFLKLGSAWTNYPLHFHELTSLKSQLILNEEEFTVHTIPLDHRIYTNGFLFTEKPLPRNLNYEKAIKLGVDQSQFNNIKNGADGSGKDGKIIPNADITFPPPPTKTYAYCSDTAYSETIVPHIKGVNALYHDATFLDTESDLAIKTKHATAREAATIAKKAGAKLLILGHYSTRYKDLELFKEQASEIFPNTELAEDGKRFEIL